MIIFLIFNTINLAVYVMKKGHLSQLLQSKSNTKNKCTCEILVCKFQAFNVLHHFDMIVSSEVCLQRVLKSKKNNHGGSVDLQQENH